MSPSAVPGKAWCFGDNNSGAVHNRSRILVLKNNINFAWGGGIEVSEMLIAIDVYEGNNYELIKHKGCNNKI